MIKVIGAGAWPGKEPVERNIVFTVPNAVTILRFLVAPLFSYMILGQDNYGIAIVLLILLGATDWIDGYLARRFNQVSKLGRFLDPVADRLSLIVIFVTLTVVDIIPWFVIVGIVTIDAILALTSLLVLRVVSSLEVTIIGKVRTALLMVGMLLILMSHVSRMEDAVLTGFSYGIFYAGCLGHVWAGIGYFLTMVRKAAVPLNEAPALTAPQKPQ